MLLKFFSNILQLSGDAHADYCMAKNKLNSPFYVWILTSFNNFFLVFNSSINFVVYCFVGRRFRNTLVSFFKKTSSNSKNIGFHTQDGTTPQAKCVTYCGTSLDLQSQSRKHSLANSHITSVTLPQIINKSTNTEKRMKTYDTSKYSSMEYAEMIIEQPEKQPANKNV